MRGCVEGRDAQHFCCRGEGERGRGACSRQGARIYIRRKKHETEKRKRSLKSYAKERVSLWKRENERGRHVANSWPCIMQLTELEREKDTTSERDAGVC